MAYATFAPFRTNEETDRLSQELYEAGRLWGSSGNAKLPKTFPLDRGDGHITNIPIVGSRTDLAHAFVEGWRETKPITAHRASGRRTKK